MSDATDDNLKELREQLAKLMHHMQQQREGSIDTDIEHLIEHVQYTPIALRLGDVLTFAPGRYAYDYAVFVRYSLPSDHSPYTDGRFSFEDDNDIIVLFGVTEGGAGLYAHIASRTIMKVNNHDVPKA